MIVDQVSRRDAVEAALPSIDNIPRRRPLIRDNTREDHPEEPGKGPKSPPRTVNVRSR